ncbi:LPS export ABC transporter ATP-binding protein [Desulfurivibrio alkaliphilus]|uniref:ABC transporter related protein n=1 Tax=Desulfurivibrio alkaliphilus (strain DSM 19089 / UNIQEM U267 / AHT2) TaxID=589865 RepID=D6Z6A7_DESAT|nr:ABC transporter related protein [Desulfurivibrio alkaliphilus AHT 2]
MSTPGASKMRLATTDIVKQYSKRRVVDGISLAVETGSVVGLLGPNGAGKTTTFYSIAGFVRPDAGRVMLDEQDITALAIHRRARLGLAYLPQESSVFKKLSVVENVRIILEPLGLGRKEIKRRTDALLDELKLGYLADNPAHSLSGGERRRVEIMRALAMQPRFILLDEPFAGIDPLSVADLQQIIKDLKNRGLGVLISDHNVRETLAVCDRAYIVNHGRILTSGTAEDIIRCPEARQLYLGEHFTL